MTLYSLPEILFLKRHGLKGLYSWGVSWGVAYVPTMQLKKLATMSILGENPYKEVDDDDENDNYDCYE